MADPWDEDLEIAQQEGDPWDTDLVETDVQTHSKSEKTARQLKNYSIFGGRFDPVAVGETALGIGGSIYDQITTGMAGVVGGVAGMWPGGMSPSESANMWMDRTRGTYQYEPRTEGGAAGMEMVGKGAEFATAGVKEIGAGYRGLAELGFGAGLDRAVESMDEFRETPNALGEGTFEATGSPTLAAVAQILPEVASLGIPAGKARPPKPAAPRYPQAVDLPPGYGNVGDVPPQPRPIPETGPGGRPPRTPDAEVPSPDLYDEVQNALKSGDTRKLMELVNANPILVRAFEELGIEFTPGMVSENQALRQVEAGMQSVPGTQLGATIEAAETALTRRARDLIDEAGGGSMASGTKTRVADEIRRDFEQTHADLVTREEAIWTELEEVIPRGIEVDARSAANRVMNEAELLGKGDIELGRSRLLRHDRELFDLTHNRVEMEDGSFIYEYEPPPYAAVNQYRQKVGNSMRSGRPFSDADQGALKLAYGEMAEVQGRVAAGNGYKAQWDEMNTLTQTRKDLEAAMTRTFGQRMQNSVISKIETATRDLLNGKVEKWDELMNDLPVDQRATAAATALDTVMFTAGKGTKVSETFVANFRKIKRDPALQARLFDELAPGTRAQFMKIGEAYTGFFRAMERTRANPSGTANSNAVIKGIEDGTVAARLFGVARTGAERIPFFGEIFKRAPDKSVTEIKRGRVKAAVDLLTDPDLRRSIAAYAAGRVDEANRILRGSSKYEGWARTLTAAERSKLESLGVAYLVSRENEE